MTDQIKIAYPKVKKEKIRGWIWRLLPNFYENADVLLIRRNDRRYRRIQREVFEQLLEFTDKPSDIEVETMNKCNSTCEFCPVNRFVDPRP